MLDNKVRRPIPHSLTQSPTHSRLCCLRVQVSMLDDKVWQVLAELPAPEALAIIEDAGDALANPHTQIRNINAYFMVSPAQYLLPLLL